MKNQLVNGKWSQWFSDLLPLDEINRDDLLRVFVSLWDFTRSIAVKSLREENLH